MNDLFYQNLGRKIKEQRKSKKLTQQALCGSDLNRSMLSQIENGLARPSVDTLLFLCKKLEIPLSYLMCESKKEEAQYKRMQTIEEIRNLYGSGQYRKCTILCRTEIEGDDEIAYIMSQCEVMLAGACLKRSALASAARHITAAKIAIQDASYGREEIHSQCSFFNMLIDAVENQKIPPMDVILKSASTVDISFILYLSLLSHTEYSPNAISSSLASQLKEEIYRSYFLARIHIEKAEYANAYQLLRFVCLHPPGFFTEFFALRDMEYCCQKIENYKEAYELAKKRLSLTERYAK
ncbi:MAG: helix-turn-helix transcriptional regulator [Clostridiales bacterium]|jgi:transcriptional regulator with XRE-family HTH domain|nr:helix-turn-helix transcriptional regulator [Clostridiales bacterium]